MHDADKPATRGDVATAIASVGFFLLALTAIQLNVLGRVAAALVQMLQAESSDGGDSADAK